MIVTPTLDLGLTPFHGGSCEQAREEDRKKCVCGSISRCRTKLSIDVSRVMHCSAGVSQASDLGTHNLQYRTELSFVWGNGATCMHGLLVPPHFEGKRRRQQRPSYGNSPLWIIRTTLPRRRKAKTTRTYRGPPSSHVHAQASSPRRQSRRRWGPAHHLRRSGHSSGSAGGLSRRNRVPWTRIQRQRWMESLTCALRPALVGGDPDPPVERMDAEPHQHVARLLLFGARLACARYAEATVARPGARSNRPAPFVLRSALLSLARSSQSGSPRATPAR